MSYTRVAEIARIQLYFLRQTGSWRMAVLLGPPSPNRNLNPNRPHKRNSDFMSRIYDASGALGFATPYVDAGCCKAY